MKIMGIVNLTPDSFSDGGDFKNFDTAYGKLDEFVKNGCSYIDIGGESTKPGASPVSLEEEQSRVVGVAKSILSRELDIKLSVDTYKSKVAEKVLQLGAHMINDISALTFDNQMIDVVSQYDCELALMHIKGTPRDMQKNPSYTNVVDEVMSFLEERANFAVKNGVSEDKIWIDPGFGFGKTYEHNLALVQNIAKFKELGFKILAGISRKSFLNQTLPYDSVASQRDASTVATSLYFFDQGVDMVRVHNVEDNFQALSTYKKIVG